MVRLVGGASGEVGSVSSSSRSMACSRRRASWPCRIRYSFVVDTKGDTDLSNDEFLADFEPAVAGPHPVFFEEADFCDLLDLLR